MTLCHLKTVSVPGSSYCWLVIIAWHDFQHFQALAIKSSANCPWKTAFLSQVRARPGTIFTDGNYVTWCAFQQKTYLCHIPRHVVLQRWHAVWNDIVERLHAGAAWSSLNKRKEDKDEPSVLWYCGNSEWKSCWLTSSSELLFPTARRQTAVRELSRSSHSSGLQMVL